MRMLGTVLLMSAVLSLSVVAQEASVASILTAAKAAAQRYPDADAVYLTNEETVKIAPDGTPHTTIHRTILLLDKNGIEQYGTAQVGYVPQRQKLKLDFARTILPDGRHTKPCYLDISDEQLGDWSDYSHQEVMRAQPLHRYSIFMPDLEEGAVIDWQVTITGAGSLVPGKGSTVWYLMQKVPVMEARYEVEVPREMPFRWAVTGTDLRPEVQTESDTVTYTFRAHGIPGIPTDEPGMPAVSALSPAVIVSTIDSWDEVAANVARQFELSSRPDQVIVREAKGLTVYYTSKRKKIDHIYRFVANQVSYSLSPHLIPLPAATTLSVKRGDCKDQAALLIALLKAVGIEAYPVLLNAYTGADVDFNLPPANGLLNHVIVAVPDNGGWWFLDPSNGTGYLSKYLPAQDANKHAMLVLGEPDRPWVEVVTPPSPPEATEILTDAEMNVYDDGDVTLQATSKLTGAEAADIQLLSDRYSDEEIQGIYQRTVDKTLPGAKIVSLSSYDPFNPYAVPVVFTTTVRKDGAVDMTKDSGRIIVPYPPPISGLMADPPDLDPEHRRFPYFAVPERIELLMYIKLPHGWRAVLPADVHVKNEVGSFTASYREEPSSAYPFTAYSCYRVLEIDAMEIPPDKIALLKQIYDAMLRDGAAEITIVHDSGE